MYKWQLRKITIIVLTCLFTACEPNEMYPVPVGAGGSGGSGSGNFSAKPAQPASTATPATSATIAPMLQDPEGKLEDDSITVYAKSLDEALKQCNRTAQNRSDQNTIVSCLGCKLMTSPKTGRYACTLRIETR